MSMTETVGGDNTNTLYLSIVGGKLAQKVDEGTPGATRRDWEVGTGDNKTSGTKYEIYHKNVTGKITGLEIKEGNYGDQFILTISNGEDSAQINTNANKTSRYFQDFAKKLPNIDLDKDIVLNSYDFTTKEGKKKTGMNIQQDGEKITSYYWDDENKKGINGIPKKIEDDDWEDHFKKECKFLIKEMAKVVLPTIADPVVEDLTADTAGEVFE